VIKSDPQCTSTNSTTTLGCLVHAELINGIDDQRMDHPSMFEPIGLYLTLVALLSRYCPASTTRRYVAGLRQMRSRQHSKVSSRQLIEL
jgi:hypothetical protein